MSHDDRKEVNANKQEKTFYQKVWDEYVQGWERRVRKIKMQD